MKITSLTFFILFLFLAPSEWITYNARDGSFRINFPSQPKETNMNSGFGIDQTQILQCFSFDNNHPDEGAVFSLTICTLSDEILKPDFNDEQRYEVIKKYATTTIALIGEITETKKVSFAGHPGIFIKGKIKQAVNEGPYPPIFAKSYLVKNKLYTLMVSASPKYAENNVHNTFFDSFELLE